MATCAQQVVEAVRQRLLGNIGTAQRVHTDRVWPAQADELPDCLVFAGREQIKASGVNYPRVQQHELEVNIVYRARAVQGLDAALDAGLLAIAGQMFDTLDHKRLTPLNVALDEVERNRVLPDPESDNFQHTDQAVGKAVLTLLAKFHTRENAPEVFC